MVCIVFIDRYLSVLVLIYMLCVLACIPSIGMYWYVLYEMVCTGTHLHVLEQIAQIDEYWLVLDCICVYWYSLAVYWYVLACIVCKRGICMYLSVLVSILCIDLLYSKQYVQLAHIDSICMYVLELLCVLVYLYVLHVSVCIVCINI